MDTKNCKRCIKLKIIMTVIFFIGAIGCIFSIRSQPIVVIYYLTLIVLSTLTTLLIEDVKRDKRKIKILIKLIQDLKENKFYM